MSGWLVCGRGADVPMTFLTLGGVNHSATSVFRGGHVAGEGLHHQKESRNREELWGRRRSPPRLTRAAFARLFIKVSSNEMRIKSRPN